MVKPNEMLKTLTVTEQDLRENLSQFLDGLEHYRRYAIVRDGREIGALTPSSSFTTHADLLAGYEAMAQDELQEAEAEEWCEGVVTDVAHEPR